MRKPSLDIVILGLSVTSSWGNGHATTYRGLVRELTARGHRVVFLERDMPWYASNRDMPKPPGCRTELYSSIADLKMRFTREVNRADAVIVGSYVPEGVAVGEWALNTAQGVVAFYDIDTPVTLSKLERKDTEYLAPSLIPRYHLYLSFTGGPTLKRIEQEFGSPMARPLYCSFDPGLYYPEAVETRWALGYMGTWSEDRQPAVDRLLLEPARRFPEGRFVVAGPQYPAEIRWPDNVTRIEHLEPARHRAFYNAQRFTLNVTRAAMVKSGYSPSVRLFEAAACATPIITDPWEGLEQFFEPGREILVAHSAEEVLRQLRELPDEERRQIGRRARRRALSSHTAAHRAHELEGYVLELMGKTPLDFELEPGYKRMERDGRGHTDLTLS